MLTIRFTRKGKKNQPFFRVVVVDKRRSSKGGRSVEDVGYVDPLKKRKSLNKKEQLQFIIESFPSIGPKTSRKLLEKFGFIELISERTGGRERHKPVLVVDSININLKI